MKSLKTILGIALSIGGFGTAATVAGVSMSAQNNVTSQVEAYGDEGKITIYFAGVSGWSDMGTVNIAVNNSWSAATATSSGVDAYAGQYKYQYSTNSNQTSLNCYFTNNQGQYRHPSSGSQDYDTNYSTIKLGSTTPLKPGHSYVITFTSWHYDKDNWYHAWFNYTFAEFELDDPSSTTNSFYVYDPHSVLGDTFANINVYGFGQNVSVKSMSWPGTHSGISQTTLGRAPMYQVALSESYPSFIMNNGSSQTGNITDLSSHLGDVLVIDESQTGSDYNSHWDETSVYTDCPATDGYYLVGDSNFVSAIGSAGNPWKYSGSLKMNSLSGEGNKANYVLTVNKTVEFRVRSYFNLTNLWLNFGAEFDGTDGITTVGDNVQLAAGTYSIYVNEHSAIYVAKGMPLDAFCSTFLTDIAEVCDAQYGNTDLDDLKDTWSSLSTLYSGLTADAKTEIRNIGFNGGSDVDDAHKVVKAYKYIVTKYGTTNCPDFIWGQTISPASASFMKANNSNNNPTIIIVLAISVVSVAALGAFFLLRKKKEN